MIMVVRPIERVDLHNVGTGSNKSLIGNLIPLHTVQNVKKKKKKSFAFS